VPHSQPATDDPKLTGIHLIPGYARAGSVDNASDVRDSGLPSTIGATRAREKQWAEWGSSSSPLRESFLELKVSKPTPTTKFFSDTVAVAERGHT